MYMRFLTVTAACFLSASALYPGDHKEEMPAQETRKRLNAMLRKTQQNTPDYNDPVCLAKLAKIYSPIPVYTLTTESAQSAEKDCSFCTIS